MSENLTQDDCRKMFLDELKKISVKFTAIDLSTPYSVREPVWWTDMSELERHIRSLIEKHSKK